MLTFYSPLGDRLLDDDVTVGLLVLEDNISDGLLVVLGTFEEAKVVIGGLTAWATVLKNILASFVSFQFCFLSPGTDSSLKYS
jgi:hypothetical protein